jgi:hypothetical protein
MVQSSVIAIDAPCRWSSDGRARPFERELRQQGIVCFASLTRQATVALPTGSPAPGTFDVAEQRGDQPALPNRFLVPEVSLPWDRLLCTRPGVAAASAQQ